MSKGARHPDRLISALMSAEVAVNETSIGLFQQIPEWCGSDSSRAVTEEKPSYDVAALLAEFNVTHKETT